MSGVPHRGGRSGSETAERILEATIDVLGRHGPRKLAMAEVSERAGVSRGTVYRYFPSRDDLLRALGEYEARRFAGKLAPALDGEQAPEARVRIAIAAALGYLQDHPALARLPEPDPSPALAYLRQQLPVLQDVLYRLIGPALERSALVRSGEIGARPLSDLLVRTVLAESVFPVQGASPTVQAVAGWAFRASPPPAQT